MPSREEIREEIDQWFCEYLARFNGNLDFNKLPKYRRITYRDMSYEIRHYLHSQGCVLKAERELPKKLTNNIGCMSKVQIEEFAAVVLRECGYSYTMKWTTAGNIVIEPYIYIDERNIGQYPYLAKYWVLHEIAHIDTHPQDNKHGELFHRKLAELINRFMAGCEVVESLI